MKLTEIFNALQYGELYNISISGDIDEPRGINKKDYPLLINHINMALTDLFSNLSLKTSELTLQLSESISFYNLLSDHAVSTGDNGFTKYIEDTLEQPFKDDILRVNAVYDEIGNEVPIDNEYATNSVYLPSHNVLQVPEPADENTLFLVYRSNHEMLDTGLNDPSTVDVDIPAYCLEPLLTYVASRVHGQNPSQDSQVKSANLKAKYDMLLAQIQRNNLLHNDPNNSNIKLGVNGWV